MKEDDIGGDGILLSSLGTARGVYDFLGKPKDCLNADVL